MAPRPRERDGGGLRVRTALRGLAAVTLLAVTACGPGDAAPRQPGGPEVTVRSAVGEVTLPVTDTGIWALDEASALHLLSLGVRPTHAARNAYSGDEIVTASYALLEEAGVELVPPQRPELVASAEPALIVGVDFPAHHEQRAQLEQIAPVLLTDDNLPWQEQLALLGAVTGHGEQADALTGRLMAQVRDTAGRIAASEHAGASVSVLSDCGDQACVYGSGRALGSLLAQLGFTRPQAQRDKGGEWGYDMVSRERLAEHTADIVLSLVGSIGGDLVAGDSPLLDTSRAVTAPVDFGAWYGSGTLNLVWMLHDLEAILFDDGKTATAAEAGRLWSRLDG
ncbi:hypothetical protein DI005_17195 [Prauserella sp. PE36]|nr:hypothetical protein DI005_17195 [Prauserella sp. PE36]